MTQLRTVAIVAPIAIVAFCSGLFLGTRGEIHATLLSTGPEKAPEGIDLDPVWKAWRLLEEKYVPATTTVELTQQARLWGMVEGLAASYDDPYTVFMPPREAESFAQEISGAFGGVGIEIGMRENILTVVAPLKDTPGEKAGIRAGDFIIEIDGAPTHKMTIDEAIERIRGEVGTAVVFKIAREGEKDFLTIPVNREIIEIPTIETELRDEGVFVISLYNFGGTAEREMRGALKKFLQSGSDALVLDLRGNPGGYLESAVEIASYFLPLGKVVVTEDYGNGNTREHRSKGYEAIDETREVVVLIDGGSASASEILAGALHEHGVAKLIGTKSFGKGSVQELVEVTPDTSLKVTVARWLTPEGVSLSMNGLEPDFVVPISHEDIETDRDPQLEVAVAYLLTGTLPDPLPVDTATSTKK